MSDHVLDVLHDRLENLDRWENHVSRPLEQHMVEKERAEIKAEIAIIEEQQ